MKKLFFAAILTAMLGHVAVAEPEIQEMNIRGVQVWLVENHQIPMVSVEVAFRAGAAFDPEGKAGLAALTAGLLNEGSVAFSAAAYKDKLQNMGSAITITADPLNITAGMVSLSENVAETFALLGKTLAEPRFSAADFTRVQQATLAALKSENESPQAVAERVFLTGLFPDHPYGHPVAGSLREVMTLSLDDIRAFRSAYITKRNMVVSVVGDINKTELRRLVSRYLLDIPTGEQRFEVANAPADNGLVMAKRHLPVPQSSILMGHKSISRDHPDYFAAFVMNYILGGGGFSSRLMEEIREKRGLTYGIYSYFNPLPKAGYFAVSVQTKNADVDTTIKLVKQEISRLQQQGVTDAEYTGAMDYLIGSFPLRLDSNQKILGYLTVMQMENLGKDYLKNWADNIRKVSKEDIQRVAKELLQPNNMVIAVVGGAVDKE